VSALVGALVFASALAGPRAPSRKGPAKATIHGELFEGCPAEGMEWKESKPARNAGVRIRSAGPLSKLWRAEVGFRGFLSVR